MEPLGNDRWRASFDAGGHRPPRVHGRGLDRPLRHLAQRDIGKRLDAGQDVRRGAGQIGADLVDGSRGAHRRDAADAPAERDAEAAPRPRRHWHGAPRRRRRGAGGRDATPPPTATTSRPRAALDPVVVDPRARPLLAPGTSCSRARRRPSRGRHGTLRDVDRPPALRRRAWASTCSTCRRSTRSGATLPQGPEQRRRAPAPDDPGSPWAIGGAEGGHTAVHPELGTLDDFRRAGRGRARARHRDRARHRLPVLARPPVGQRAPGVVPAPARRHDPVRREPAQEVPGHLPVRLRDARTGAALWDALRDVVRVLDRARASTIFRVDNPHTKPFAFWEWLHRRGQARPPGRDLPGRGVHPPEGDVAAGQGRASPSRYTYFTWRNDEAGARPSTSPSSRRPPVARVLPAELLAEHARHPARAPADRRPARRSPRGSCWPRRWRASYGIYGPAFELVEHVAARAGQRGVPRLGEVPAPALGPRRDPTACAPLIARGQRGSAASTRRCSATSGLRFHDDRQRRAARLQRSAPRTARRRRSSS